MAPASRDQGKGKAMTRKAKAEAKIATSDVYQRITNRLVEQLEAGTGPGCSRGAGEGRRFARFGTMV